MALTDTNCRNAKPREKAYKLSDAGGLYLQIAPSGSKLWKWKYRFGGVERKLSLGQYPDVTLAEAREEQTKARKLLAANQDPSLAKQEAKRTAVANAATTFEAVAREWHEKQKVAWSENHARTVLRRFEMDVFPQIGNLPIADIKMPRIAMMVETIAKRGAYEMARRALEYSRAVFSYAQLHGKIEHNPADIKASKILKAPETGHFNAMSAKDLPVFLSKLHSNEARVMKQTKLAMQMMLLTFVRTKELINARWEEFDFGKGQWVIPAARMKMKRDHIVPLSKQTLAILQELKQMNGHRDWVFTNQRDPRRAMSNGAILVALNRMGYKGIHTGHGFRALAMTTLREELGYAYELPDIQLAHAKSGNRAAYDRSKFLPERIEMMQRWADYLDGAANGKIVSMHTDSNRVKQIF